MLKPAVCARELCIFAFSNLKVDSVSSTTPEVVDLLIAMAKAACKSKRKVLLFEPFPMVVDPRIPGQLAFDPKRPDYRRAAAALDSIPEMNRVAALVGSGALKRSMDGVDESAYPLLNWIISSNRSQIVKLPVHKRLDFMNTPHQFLLLCSPPTKVAAFGDLKLEHGGAFAFHESKFENWHGFIRNGLFNATGTRHQKHICLSPIVSVGFHYSGIGLDYHQVTNAAMSVPNPAAAPPLSPRRGGGGGGSSVEGGSSSSGESGSSCGCGVCGDGNGVNSASSEERHFLQSENLSCIALCEVINSPWLMRHGSIWICPNSDHVCTRFFFVYEDGLAGEANVDTTLPEYESKIVDAIAKLCD